MYKLNHVSKSIDFLFYLLKEYVNEETAPGRELSLDEYREVVEKMRCTIRESFQKKSP